MPRTNYCQNYPAGGKYHRPCLDCHYCQDCSKDRCRLCRAPKRTTHTKLSIAEQIALYERMNKKKGKKME